MARQLELQREQLSIMEGLFARDLDYPLQSIFLSLDPVSLKSSRLVCTQWSKFIKGRVWGTSKDSAPNSRLRQRLAYHWIHATPTAKSVVLEPDSPDDSFADSGVVYSLSCDDSIVACGLYDYSAKVYDLLNLNLLAVLDSLPPTGLIINDFGGVVVDVGRDVVATVRNMGDVSVWRRSDWSPVFQGRSHGDVIVTQVKVLANLIITGGYDGSLALLSWDGDQVSLMRMIQDEACCPITGLDSDGEWLVYGTPRKLNVWNLADNKLVHNLAMQRDSSDNSFEESVVLNYPYAVVLNQKVDVMKVMDLRTGQLIKYLHGYEAHGLHHNKSILVGSVKHDNEQHSVYFCDLRQITNPQQNGPRWKRRKYLEAEDGAGVVRSCVNTSCLVAVLGNKLHVWDFWNCDDFEDTPDIDNMVDLNDNSGEDSDNRVDLNDNSGEDSDNRVDLNDNSGEDSDNRVDLNDNSGEDGDNMADLNDNSGEDGDNMVDLNDNSGKDGDNMVDMIDN